MSLETILIIKLKLFHYILLACTFLATISFEYMFIIGREVISKYRDKLKIRNKLYRVTDVVLLFFFSSWTVGSTACLSFLLGKQQADFKLLLNLLCSGSQKCHCVSIRPKQVDSIADRSKHFERSLKGKRSLKAVSWWIKIKPLQYISEEDIESHRHSKKKKKKD